MSRKKKHEAHGGAWKVAYADFVTAMMALFMVLWISSQKKEILIATSKYFQNPFISPMQASSGVMNGTKDNVEKDENAMPTRQFTPEMYAELAREFLRLLDLPQNKEKEPPIEVKVTNDGILIVVYNRNKQPLFDGPSTQFTEWGEFVGQNLAWVIDRFKMRVRVDSHLPKGLVADTAETSGWDLSAAQSNAMRRKLVYYGLDATKIDRVSGYSDTQPMGGLKPEDPGNYRIEMILSATTDTPFPSQRKTK